MNKPAPRALIVGMGIGGLATAMRLHDIGWDPVIVERASERRAARLLHRPLRNRPRHREAHGHPRRHRQPHRPHHHHL
ncbi:hypothetical protein R2F25_09035 [Streptomyces sp. UP1A-1]|nr:hypothetical protein [Streptomyces sp. UP1A-1]